MKARRCSGDGPLKTRLEGEARASALAGIKEWHEVAGRDAIARRFTFPDFMAAIGFMGRVAVYADTVDHHPEWSNVYNRVDVTLASHDVDGLTERDIRMAQFMDRAAALAMKGDRR